MNSASITSKRMQNPSRLPVIRATDDEQPVRSGAIWVDTDGGIQDCNGDTEAMFGYWRDELRGRHISLLLPFLSQTELTGKNGINPRLAFLCRCAMAFLGRNRDGNEREYSVFFSLISRKMGRVIKIIIV
jgi:PAS domain S-box-containing protein